MDRRNVFALVGSLGISLLVLELGLRAFSAFPVHSRHNTVSDIELGYRMDPTLPDVDAAGFRNPAVLRQADLVTLGDSHTYGTGAASPESWPHQLGRMTRKTVYNLGIPGYGILQYWILLRRALRMQPRAIVLGLYLENDLGDVCRTVQSVEFWRQRARAYGLDEALCPDAARPRSGLTSLWLRTATGSAIRWTWNRVRARVAMVRESRVPERDVLVLRVEPNPAVIPAARIAAHLRQTDRRRPEIAQSWAALRRFLREAAALCDSAGVHLLVLLIPSKELVYHTRLADRVALPANLQRLAATERGLMEDAAALLDTLGVPTASALPTVLEAVDSVSGVYSLHDSHPSATGYSAYARAAAALIRTQSPLTTALPPRS